MSDDLTSKEIKMNLQKTFKFMEKYGNVLNVPLPQRISNIFIHITKRINEITRNLTASKTKETLLDVGAEIAELASKTNVYMKKIRNLRLENFDVITDIKNGIDTTIQPVKQIMNDTLTSFNNLFNIIQTLPKTFESGFNNVQNTLTSAVNTTSDSIKGVSDGIVSTLNNSSQGVLNTITDFSKTTTNKVSQFGDKTIGTVSQISNDTLSNINDSKNLIINSVGDVANKTLTQINGIGKSVTGTITDFAKNTTDKVGELGDNSIKTITNLSNNAISTVSGVSDKVVGTVGDFAKNSLAETTKIGENVIDNVNKFSSDTLGTVKQLGDVAINTISDTFQKTFSVVKEIGTGAIDKIKLIYESIDFSQIFNWIKDNFNKIINWVIEAFNWIKDFLLNTLPTFVGDVKRATTQFLENLKVTWFSLPILVPFIYSLQNTASKILVNSSVIPDLIAFVSVFIYCLINIYYFPDSVLKLTYKVIGNPVSKFILNIKPDTNFIVEYQKTKIVNLKYLNLLSAHLWSNLNGIIIKLLLIVGTFKFVLIDFGLFLLKEFALRHLETSLMISGSIMTFSIGFLFYLLW